MIVLGLSGGPDTLADDPVTFPYADGYWHDAAAVLLVDGEVIVGHEEERLTRLKNTSKFPSRAVEACLDVAGLRLRDVDAVGVYFTEWYWDRYIGERMSHDPSYKALRARPLIAERLTRLSPVAFPQERIHFVRHHMAHAASAWWGSGFDRTLIVTMDGAGDTEAGAIWTYHRGVLSQLDIVRTEDSLGGLYLWVTRYLGYSQFDEYKVMGLASQGDRKGLGPRLKMVDLYSNGRFRVDWTFTHRLGALRRPRRNDEEFDQFHADLAAAAQDALEEAVLHLLRHAQTRTGERNLCLAGGVAHNCSLNGAIAATERFEELFVQPASHDAGCALGAAIVTDRACSKQPRPSRRLRTVFWGSDISAPQIRDAARRWAGFAIAEPIDDVFGTTAHLLATGSIVGWVHGRAEFGPRALGHRSLLADPRSSDVAERINGLLKRRELFRPFAPVVRYRDASRFFDIKPGADCSFMSFTVPVKPEWQDRLPAITHVDGTARVQTISFDQDHRLSQLLDDFDLVTGVPILLNTSLNTAGEPIVDSIDDALVFLLTAELDCLVAGDWIFRRTAEPAWPHLAVRLPPDASLCHRRSEGAVDEMRLVRGGPGRRSASLSPEMFDLLHAAASRTTALEELAGTLLTPSLLLEALELWAGRYIELLPLNTPDALSTG